MTNVERWLHVRRMTAEDTHFSTFVGFWRLGRINDVQLIFATGLDISDA